MQNTGGPAASSGESEEAYRASGSYGVSLFVEPTPTIDETFAVHRPADAATLHSRPASAKANAGTLRRREGPGARSRSMRTKNSLLVLRSDASAPRLEGRHGPLMLRDAREPA